MDRPPVMVAHCTRTQILEIASMRNRGMPAKTIAYHTNRGPNQVRRYLRVYERYGLGVFANDNS